MLDTLVRPNFVQVIKGTDILTGYLCIRFEGVEFGGNTPLAATLILNAKDADGLGRALVDQAKAVVVADHILLP